MELLHLWKSLRLLNFNKTAFLRQKICKCINLIHVTTINVLLSLELLRKLAFFLEEEPRTFLWEPPVIWTSGADFQIKIIKEMGTFG